MQGGKRPGAGRPKGAKNTPARVLSAKVRVRLARLERSENARAFACDWLRAAEPEILRRAVEHEDWRFAAFVWREMRRAAFGAPVQSLSVEVGPSPAEIIRQIIERRTAGALPASRQLPQAIDAEAVPRDGDGSDRPS